MYRSIELIIKSTSAPFSKHSSSENANTRHRWFIIKSPNNIQSTYKVKTQNRITKNRVIVNVNSLSRVQREDFWDHRTGSKWEPDDLSKAKGKNVYNPIDIIRKRFEIDQSPRRTLTSPFLMVETFFFFDVAIHDNNKRAKKIVSFSNTLFIVGESGVDRRKRTFLCEVERSIPTWNTRNALQGKNKRKIPKVIL